MARYIDADAFLDKFNKALESQQHYGLYNHAKITQYVIKAIENEPTADVVPKDEVKQLRHKYDLAVEEREANIKGFTEQLLKVKAEVAAEVIDDLATQGLLNVESWGIAELKKKYAEVKNDD